MKELTVKEIENVSGGCCGLIIAGVALGALVLKPALEGGSLGNGLNAFAGKVSETLGGIAGKLTA